MFDRICINRQDPFGTPIDVGFLAESLVFYRRVHVVADSEMFKCLLRVCGHEVLIEMLEMGNLTLDYIEDIPLVAENSAPVPLKVYDFGLGLAEELKYQNFAPRFL